MLEDYDLDSKEELYATARDLLYDVVMGGPASADSILNDLKMAINNLKENWKGKDAGIRIQQLIDVYNQMIVLRKDIGGFAVDAGNVVLIYSSIQGANGAQGDGFTKLGFDEKTVEQPYSDLSDAVKINSMAAVAKRSIDSACNSLSTFKTNFDNKYLTMAGNWRKGPGRVKAEALYDNLEAKVSNFQSTLMDVSNELDKALKNYSI